LDKDGIKDFFMREVLPHASDAWINAGAPKIGHEINFNRYFYKTQPLRSLTEICADILALEQKTDGLLQEISNKSSGIKALSQHINQPIYS
jgi:type I restriction enzyme M protein